MYRSRNLTLSDSTFDKSNYQEATWWNEDSNLMTMEDCEKTGILLILHHFCNSNLCIFHLFHYRFLGGFITAMIVIFSKSTNPVLICGYAVFEGIALGGFTYFVELSVDHLD